MTYLPEEILDLVCTQLWHQRDFHTLFNCACSGKQLATLAVKNLYRMHGVSPSDEMIPAHNSPDAIKLAHERFYLKCAGLWRTIILSSLGKTLYPYSRHIRTLDLGELEELLEECESTTPTISKVLFHDELAQFEVEGLKISSYSPRLDLVETIGRIGEAITKQTPLLEELSGRILSGTLSRWIPQLPRLTHLRQYSGTSVLRGNGTLIRLHCPMFKRLEIQDWWNHDNSDEVMGVFLNELRPQSLESFETSSFHNIGPKSLHALNCHAESLTNLKLERLSSDTLHRLSLLRGCTNLISLSLAGKELSTPDLDIPHYDGFDETASWLRECKKLRYLAFAKFFHAPTLMGLTFSDISISLTSLSYKGFIMRDAKKFHQALASQTSLQSLRLNGIVDEGMLTDLQLQRIWLKGDVDEYELDADVMVESLSNLVNLTNLHMSWICNSFDDRHIIQLARSLPKLEVWSTSGNWLTDAIWGEIASLRSLRRLELGALSSFTANGILDFIKKVGPGNQGLHLSVRNAKEISLAEQELIQDTIDEKVEGTFYFMLTTDLGRVLYDQSDSDDYE